LLSLASAVMSIAAIWPEAISRKHDNANRNVWSAALSQAKNEGDKLACANVFGLVEAQSSGP
jgi:hypothetical protein